MLPARLAAGVNVAVLPLTLTDPVTGVPVPVTERVNVEPFSVALFIGSENVTITALLSATLVAPLAGNRDTTVGGVASGGVVVVNSQLKLLANALPATSRAPVVIVAVYCVLPSSAALGVNVAVLPPTPTEPATGVPVPVSAKVKVAVVSVALFIASEKVADGAVPSATPVAPLTGVLESTVGGVLSGGAVVVNDQLKFEANALSAASRAPVVIVAVY